MGDRALLERAQEGHEAAFEALFRAHEEAVTGVCRRMLGAEEGGKDAVQEVFLRARRGLASCDPERPFRPWLLAVAGHHCVDRLRRRRREAKLFEPTDLDATPLADPGPSPLRHALDAEARDRLRDAVDGLPDRYRLPLVLRYFQEQGYDEIAEVLGVSRGQVGSLLFRARRLLREQLGESP